MIKYSKTQEELIKFFENEFFLNKNFYKRRLYFNFFDECNELFSMKFNVDYGILDNIIKFFDDNNLIITKLFQILPSFYPLILEHTRIKFIVLNKLEYFRKNIISGVIKDSELIKVNYR